MYDQPAIVAGTTVIKSTDLVELRSGVDAFRAAFGFGTAFESAAPPGVIRANDFIDLVTVLNAAAGSSNFTFGYSVLPQAGNPVLRIHVTELREALR